MKNVSTNPGLTVNLIVTFCGQIKKKKQFENVKKSGKSVYDFKFFQINVFFYKSCYVQSLKIAHFLKTNFF